MIKSILVLFLLPILVYGADKQDWKIPVSFDEFKLIPFSDNQRKSNAIYMKDYNLNIIINKSLVDVFNKKIEQNQLNESMISGGTGIGNGGDMVLCDGKIAQFLDYHIAHKLELSLDRDFARGLWRLRKENSIKSLESIYQILFKINNNVANEFKEFTSSYLSHYMKIKPSKDFIWVRDSENSLFTKNVTDENLEFRLDKNCYLKQLFVRLNSFVNIASEEKHKNIILFNPTLMEKISLEDTQLSFALTHEFLWNFIRRDSTDELKKLDSRVIRGLNYFLHSGKAINLPEDKLKEQIRKLGFNDPTQSPLTFNRSNYINGNYYEKYLALSLAEENEISFIVSQMQVENSKDELSLIELSLIDRGILLGVKTLNLQMFEAIISLLDFKDGISRFESIALQLISITGSDEYHKAIRKNKKIMSFLMSLEAYRLDAINSGAHHYHVMGLFMSLSGLKNEVLSE